MWTQTYDDELDDDDDDDDSDGEDGDGHSDNSSSSTGTGSKRSKRRKRRGVKIFHKGADYSHIKSKVETGAYKSPKTKKKQDDKYYLGVWQAKGGKPTDAEIAKLRAQLAEVWD